MEAENTTPQPPTSAWYFVAWQFGGAGALTQFGPFRHWDTCEAMRALVEWQTFRVSKSCDYMAGLEDQSHGE